MTSLPTTWVKLAFSPVTMAVLVAWSNSILAPMASSAARSGTIVRPFFTSGTASVKAMHRSPSSTLTCPATPPSALMFCSRCSFETGLGRFGFGLGSAGSQSQNHDQRQKQSDQFFHFSILLPCVGPLGILFLQRTINAALLQGLCPVFRPPTKCPPVPDTCSRSLRYGPCGPADCRRGADRIPARSPPRPRA